MTVVKKGSFNKIRNDARAAIEHGVEAFSWEVLRRVKDATPSQTGGMKSRWSRDVRGSSAVVGNYDEKAELIAVGPKNRPPTPRERKNIGFHIRAATGAAKQLHFIFRRAFKVMFP